MDFDNLSDVGDLTAPTTTLRSPAFESDTLYRIIDPEAGVVCYHLSEKDSLTCIPVSETELDLESELSG